MSETDRDRVKVGDELAFKQGHSRYYRIERVERILPSGRIVAGHYTMNPDLTVRGRDTYSGPYRGEEVTDEIRESVRRKELLDLIRRKNFEPFTTAELESIGAVIVEHERLAVLAGKDGQ